MRNVSTCATHLFRLQEILHTGKLKLRIIKACCPAQSRPRGIVLGSDGLQAEGLRGADRSYRRAGLSGSEGSWRLHASTHAVSFQAAALSQEGSDPYVCMYVKNEAFFRQDKAGQE